MEVNAVRGMHDLFGDEVHKWLFVEGKITRILSSFGYQEIRTPALEKIDVFSQTVGLQTDIVEKQMYLVKESDTEMLVLRPEGTASFMRAVVEHGLHRSGQAQRYFYYLPMFRHERPQKGRLRQFFQFGAELINDPTPHADVELLFLFNAIYHSLGVTEYETEINSVGCAVCRPKYVEILRAFYKPKAAELCPDCQKRLDRAPLRILDCKNEPCRSFAKEAPLILDHLCQECSSHHQELKVQLQKMGVPFKENPRIVRGLDYYCRTAFEFTSPLLGAQNALGGGGRYDGLSERFGVPAFPAIGWAFGVERLMLALDQKQSPYPPVPKPFAYLAPLGEQAFTYLFNLSLKLKKNGIWVEMSYDKDKKLKGLLKEADRWGAELAIILGDDELNASQAVLRNMNERSQENVALDNLEQEVIRRYQRAP